MDALLKRIPGRSFVIGVPFGWLLLFFLLLVVGGGIWLANAMFEQRALDDCMAQGRRNCAPPIDTPAR